MVRKILSELGGRSGFRKVGVFVNAGIKMEDEPPSRVGHFAVARGRIRGIRGDLTEGGSGFASAARAGIFPRRGSIQTIPNWEKL
jgi:hypothetical protein